MGRTVITTLSILYGSKGQTRVLVYLEDRILEMAFENIVFRLAMSVGFRCKLVLTCDPAVPRRGG